MKVSEEFKSRFTCDAPEYLPSELLDRLKFLSCLRKENDHSIYLVNDAGTPDKLILKIAEKGAPNNLQQEYELLEKLKHTGIPKAHFFHSDEEEREYLLRAYAEGDTLKSLLERDGVFSERQTLEIALKICEILDYLHSQTPPVIYRDISPENVVITPNGKLSLIDFGISREDKGEKKFDTVYVGNVAFASPEQFGFSKTDHRSDIFAIGKLMIYLATGETGLQPCTEKIPAGGLRKIITRCTQLSPEKRYTSVTQLSRSVVRVLTPPTRREYLTAALCMLIIVAVGMTLGLRWLMPSSEPAPVYAPVSAAGDEVSDEVKIPVLIETLYGGKQFADCAVAVDNHHWFKPAKNGKAELAAYAFDNYNISAVYGNRTAVKSAAVTRETQELSFSFDFALVPNAPEYQQISAEIDERYEIPLEIEGADEVVLTGQPNGVSAIRLGDGFVLIVDGVEQSGHYAIFAEWSNEYGRADTIISLDLAKENGITYIKTAQDLNRVRENLSGHYVITNDIDLSGFGHWTPIGTSEYPFTGIFDGGGYSISGLSIYGDLDLGSAGLFGCCVRASIRNVSILEPNVQATSVQSTGIATLVGRMEKGIIENCTVLGGSLSADISYYGAAGGICGMNSGIITKCFNSAQVTITDTGRSGTESMAGGICGENTGYILGCGNAGLISGVVMAAGITGFCDAGIVTHCYNAGTVQAPVYMGDFPPGGIVHMLGRGKRVSYCAFETGSAPVGVTVWNGGTLLSIEPLPPEKIRDIETLQNTLRVSGTEFGFKIKAGLDYPVPIGAPIK